MGKMALEEIASWGMSALGNIAHKNVPIRRNACENEYTFSDQFISLVFYPKTIQNCSNIINKIIQNIHSLILD